MEKYGIIKNALSHVNLDNWKAVYQKLTPTETNEGDPCWGIDVNCLAYNWFLKEVMSVIQHNSPHEVKLIFSSFINLHNPIGIHRDIKEIPNGGVGKHYRSVLFPYAVDNDRTDFKNASTRVYDDNKILTDTLTWEPDSILWWDSEVLHDSGDFMNHDIKSKEYIITHTYVQ